MSAAKLPVIEVWRVYLVLACIGFIWWMSVSISEKECRAISLKCWHEGFHAGEQAQFIRSLPVVQPDPKPEE